MTIKKLLDKCEELYYDKDFISVIGLCDEVLEIEPENLKAISYKSIACCFTGQPQKTVELLAEPIRKHPGNQYFNNNLAMAYYDLGRYEESLRCCERGLKNSQFDWLYENKIKALLKLERTDEAIECYENGPFGIDIYDLLIGEGKYSEALKYSLEEDPEEFNAVVDKVKAVNPKEAGEYYISWIYRIKSKNDVRTCPDCGGKLLPIYWGYPDRKAFKRADRGEIFLGGCVVEDANLNYHCKTCAKDFALGYEGLEVEWVDNKLNEYIEYKIREITKNLKEHSAIYVRALEGLKKDLKGFDGDEFNAFITHLENLEFISSPREGFIKLVGYDDFKCAKEYLDEGKFAAPNWLAFPSYTAWTIGWRMGSGENYAMNEPHRSEEFKRLFPMPKYWHFRFSESHYKPHPLLGFFWNEDGKPEYPNSGEGIEVNAFITLEDEKEFFADTFSFSSIAHAEALSKSLYFEKYGDRKDFDSSKELEYTPEEERIWDIYRYSVLLNASYFKIMEDAELKEKLLETGDEPLIYVSDDEENLFGRALMELRDEIRRLCENENLIDWGYTEYLKFKPWM